MPCRVYTTKSYPLLAPNGSKVILYGHENGVNIIWRGGRPFKPAQELSSSSQKTNGSTNAVISLDSDDEGESGKPFEDKVEFEDEEEELDPLRPYPAVLQSLDLSLGTGVLHLALLPSSLLKADGPSYRGLESLKRNVVFVAACADSSVRLITLPLTPPSPASKTRSEFRQDFTSANGGRGKWGESVVMLSGHQSPVNGLSMTVETISKSVGKSNTSAEPHFIIASHSTEVSGRLLLFRVSVKSPESVEPFQTIYLSSPARCVSFNTGLAKELSSHLLVADSVGVCRIYDYKLLIRGPEEPAENPSPEKGTWLLSLYAGFNVAKSDSTPQNLGMHAGFGRKSIIDAKWVLGGRAVIILLDDGEWAIWDIEGVGPDASKGLLGRQGIKGGSKSEYSLSGYLDNSAKTRPSGPPQLTTSKFAPMTPGTRKSTAPFSTKAVGGPILGQISIMEVPASSATNVAEESVLLWYGETYSIISNLAKYWAANSRKTGGSGNLFNGPSNGRVVKLESVNLQGERCSGVEQLTKTASSSQSEFIILGEHRYIILSTGKLLKSHSTDNTGRLALTANNGNGGELDVGGIEQALTRMENGFGMKRKIFQS